MHISGCTLMELPCGNVLNRNQVIVFSFDAQTLLKGVSAMPSRPPAAVHSVVARKEKEFSPGGYMSQQASYMLHSNTSRFRHGFFCARVE